MKNENFQYYFIIKNMANPQLSIKRLMREREKMESNPNDQFFVVPNPSNLFEWHFILMNIRDSPFQGGQFHGKILIPADYPLKPPALLFLTPQGRFKIHEKICLYASQIVYVRSFTSHHPESWSTSWTIEGMLVALISFMHTNDRTVGGIECSDAQKVQIAKQSIGFNLRNQVFQEIFKDHYQRLGLNEPQNIQINHIQQGVPVDSYQDLAQPLDEIQMQNQIDRNKKKKILTYIGLSVLLIALFILVIGAADD